MESRQTTWGDLLPDVVKRIARSLSMNEIACTMRLVNKAAAELFPADILIKLSELVPHHAFVRRWSRPEAVHNLGLGKRRQLLALTARSGCLANFQVALMAAGCALTDEVFNAAAGGGHLEMCIWLVARDCPRSIKYALDAAACGGHLAVVRWLLHEQSPENMMAAGFLVWAAAAGAGQRAVCEGLAADHIAFDWDALLASARGGHEALTDWLMQLPGTPAPEEKEVVQNRGAIFRFQRLLLAAAACGLSLPALQRVQSLLQAGWLLADLADKEPDRTIMVRLYSGYLVLEALASPTPDWMAKVQWLQTQERGAIDDAFFGGFLGEELRNAIARRPDSMQRAELALQLWPETIDVAHELLLGAVYAANLPLLRRLAEGRPWLPGDTDHAAGEAVLAGNLEVLKELVALGWTVALVENWDVTFAVIQGCLHVHALQWLAGPEAELAGGEEALENADGLGDAIAASGNVEMMEWLRRDRGYILGERTFTEAADGGASPAFLEWLVAEGCPMGADGAPYVSAGTNGDMLTLRCLKRLDCPWDLDGTAFNCAVSDGKAHCSFEILQWLVSEGCPVNWKAAWRKAQHRTDSQADAVRAWVHGQLPEMEGQNDDD